MAPNVCRGGFPVRHFVHNYTHDSKTKGHIRTFYLSNNFSSIGDTCHLGQSCVRDTIVKLWIQTCIATTFWCDVLCILALVTRKLQVIVCGHSTQRMTALLLEMSIFCVRAGCEIRMASYASKHTLQSLSDEPFLHIQCTQTHRLKTSCHMWTFSILNDCYIIGDILCVVQLHQRSDWRGMA